MPEASCSLMQASSEKTCKAADVSLEAAEKAAAAAAEQIEALRAQEQEAQAQVKTLKERLASMRASKFKANEKLTRSGFVRSQPSVNSCSHTIQSMQPDHIVYGMSWQK